MKGIILMIFAIIFEDSFFIVSGWEESKTKNKIFNVSYTKGSKASFKSSRNWEIM